MLEASKSNAVDIIEALHYKFCMFGFPVNSPTDIFWNNGAVSVKTTRAQ